MSISEKINGIIARRKESLPRIEQRHREISQLRSKIEDMEIFRRQGALREALDEEQLSRINSIPLEKMKSECDLSLRELDRLSMRFSRDSIHLSFVGKARSGKSLLMQKISGLDGRVIPSASSTDCTGAKSVITNSDDEGVSAVIEFYSKEEIVEVVNRYITAIFGDTVAPVGSLSEIPRLIDRLPESLDPSKARGNSKYDRLMAYIEHIGNPEIMEKLGEKNVSVPGSDIEKYVAQYKSDDPTVRYYNFLAVKKADIRCRFPYDECGKLVLVDTIGLGDTSLGIEEGMMKAIRDDSDGIIYLKRPDVLGDHLGDDDFDIAQKISDSENGVSPEYASEMLFWVLNKVTGEQGNNLALVENLKNRLLDLVSKNAIAVNRVICADCKDREDVENSILIPVLEQMSERLEAIDELLISRFQARLDRLQELYREIASDLRSAASKSLPKDMKRCFEERIYNLYGEWTGKLRAYCVRLYKDRDKEDENFKAAFTEKLKKTLKVPDKEQIRKQLSFGNVTPQMVYQKATDYKRISIINTFSTLDQTLDVLVRGLKKDIMKIMCDDGLLGKVVPECEDPDEWFRSLMEKLGDEDRYNPVKEAVLSLVDFSLSVKGYLIYGVRNSLDLIDMQMNQAPVLDGIGGVADPDEQAESIQAWLNRYMADIYSSIQENNRQYLKFPNSALFAAARDFYDRVTFTVEEYDSQVIDMTNRWREIYEDHIMEIWGEECAGYERVSRSLTEFNELVRELKSFDRPDAFRI